MGRTKRIYYTLEERGIGRVYDAYKDSARIRNIKFFLTREQVGSLIKEPCSYCGRMNSNRRLVQSTKGDEYFPYNGIDRVNNNLGYVLLNCITCCKICNYAKKDMTMTEFYRWVCDLKIGDIYEWASWLDDDLEPIPIDFLP